MSASRPPERADPPTTTLVGVVRDIEDRPISGVTFRIGGRLALTDEEGVFSIHSLTARTHVLHVDGGTTDKRDVRYGSFAFNVDLLTTPRTVLQHIIWLPAIDDSQFVKIPSPTTQEIVLETPEIPGLEVRIMTGTVILDTAGNIVTEIAIAPIPVNRPPFPMPSVEFPVYFTVQPANAYFTAGGMKVLYPNSSMEPPATRIDYWYYAPGSGGWRPYGQGTVRLRTITDARGIVVLSVEYDSNGRVQRQVLDIRAHF